MTDLSDENKDIRCTLNSVASLTQNLNTILTKLKVMCENENLNLSLNSDSVEILKVINGVGNNLDKIKDQID